MDPHDRLMEFKTTNGDIIDMVGKYDLLGIPKSEILKKIASLYNDKIYGKTYELSDIQSFRDILCYEYESTTNSRNENGPLDCKGCSYVDFTKFFIDNNTLRTREELSVLYDIAVLQVVLYSNKQLLRRSFDEFCDSSELSAAPRMRDLALRVSECFVDCCILHGRLYEATVNWSDWEAQCDRIMRIIERWLDQSETLDWIWFALLVPKLVTFDSHKIVPLLWEKIIGFANNAACVGTEKSDNSADLNKILNALCLTADVYFPSEIENIEEFHYKQCTQREFWCILKRAVLSTVANHRKQALYLIKKAMEVADLYESRLKQKSSKMDRSSMPFICAPSQNEEPSPDEMRKTFYSILEVLEEMHNHLVLAILSRLPRLSKIHDDDSESCSDCFNVDWLRCVFTRILQHENESVGLFGMQKLFKCDTRIFLDEEFLLRVVEALNNPYFYKINDGEEKPRIAEQLEECLSKWEKNGTLMINAIVRRLGSVSWSPVPIYWVLTAILGVSQKCEIATNKWRSEELRSLRIFTRNILNTLPLKMRSLTSTLIIHMFKGYCEMPVDPADLDCMFIILSSLTEFKNQMNDTSGISILWTRGLIQRSDAQEYVVRMCEKKLTMNLSLRSFADLIVSMELHLTMFGNGCPARKALRDLMENLVDADARPYADQDLVIKVLLLTSHLLHRLGDLCCNEMELSRLALLYCHEITKIVSRSLQRNTTIQPLINHYLFAIAGVIDSGRILNSNCFRKELKTIEEKYFHVIANPDNFCKTQWQYAIRMWEVFARTDNNAEYHEQSTKNYLPLVLGQFMEKVVGKVALQDKSPKDEFVSDCSKAVVALMAALLIRYDVLYPSDLWFKGLMAIIEGDNDDVVPDVSKILVHLLRRNSSSIGEDLGKIDVAIRTLWRTVLRLKHTSAFTSAMSSIIPVIINDKFLELDGAKEYANECIEQMIKEDGECCEFSSRRVLMACMKLLKPENKLLFQKTFIFCLIHEAAPQQDRGIVLATEYHHMRFNHELDGDLGEDDGTTRKYAVDYLIHTMYRPESTQIRDNLLTELLEILEKNKNIRYVENDDLHRLKNRVMQTLLIMEPTLDNSQSQWLGKTLCAFLIEESNQPSVRLMHEWLLIRLCLSGAVTQETLWKLFEVGLENRSSAGVSLASIVFHLAKQYSGETQTKFISTAILQLLTICMCQQYSIRLYSLTVVTKIYEMLPKNSPEAESFSNRIIFDSAKESLSRGNLMKNSTRILNDFWFKIFDPILDYNVETIYHDLPRLTNVALDEWLLRSAVLGKTGIFLPDGIPIESRDEFRVAEPMLKSLKPTGDLTESADSAEENDSGDVRRNVNHWRTMEPTFEGLPEKFGAKRRQQTLSDENAGIIVVASLIDRPQNLGGLASTCDIMGAKELVIGSLRYVENPEFQKLSESAEKCIKITEVKRHLLENYLVQKKSEGWELFGAEQTANSKSVLDVKFPKKTILLLGNEKYGISTELIQLLDLCVEIPQIGVVRSLNVHVAGAICMWEYVHQHISS